jgi:hypothetical protein
MNDADLKKMGKMEQLQLARAKLKETGQSPTVIGRSNLLKVLLLIYRWGYTTPSITQLLLGITKGGYLQKLTEQGWLKKVTTESGNPQAIYTLTETGLGEAERNAAIQIRYVEIDPYRINQQLLRHNLLAQEITINALKSGVIDDYRSERMLSTQDKPGQKRVDACWLKSQTIKIGIEIELSKKWDRKLDEFVGGVINALENNIYSQFIIFSDSPAIISAYSLAMQPDTTYRTWKKNNKGVWQVDEVKKVPAWLVNKVSFQLI